MPEAGPDRREQLARQWLAGRYADVGDVWRPMAGDASFRRYFRLTVGGRSHVLMDAPPERESSQPFLDVSRRLRAAGLHAPEVIATDPAQGFILLEDLGERLYRDLVTPTSVEPLFADAFAALAVMAGQVDPAGLPAYDARVLGEELALFRDWYLARHKGCPPDRVEARGWQALCDELVQAALAQPQVFVHKDIHSCNLLVTESANPGIIDFQDALRGPLSYDFVSLVWDRYISWPRHRLEQWMERFRLMLDPAPPSDQWVQWCDLMGLQRNLKIVGIFARLWHRDGKSGYVEMIPRFYAYVLEALRKLPRHRELCTWLEGPECAP